MGSFSCLIDKTTIKEVCASNLVACSFYNKDKASFPNS